MSLTSNDFCNNFLSNPTCAVTNRAAADPPFLFFSFIMQSFNIHVVIGCNIATSIDVFLVVPETIITSIMLYVLLSIYCTSVCTASSPRPTSNLSSCSRDLRGREMESIGDRQHELMRNRRSRRKSQITLFNRTTLCQPSPAPTLPTTQSYRSHHSPTTSLGKEKKHTSLYPSGGAS